jgi:uncharacterized membrane protein
MPESDNDKAVSDESSELTLPADLPPEVIELAKEDPNVLKAVRIIIAEQYKGPIPPPRILREFEEIVPGSAKDLIEDFKSWGQLNRDLLRSQVGSELEQDRADRTLAFRGQTIATSIISVFGVAGIVRIFMGDPIGGGLLLAPALLGGLTRLFLTGGRFDQPSAAESPKETPQDASKPKT